MKFANGSMSAESIFFYMALTGVMLVPLAWTMTGPEVAAVEPGLYVKGFFTQMLNSVGALTLVYAYRYGKATSCRRCRAGAAHHDGPFAGDLRRHAGADAARRLVLATVALVALSIE